MPYRKSPARQDFDGWADEALRLARKADTRSVRGAGVSGCLLCGIWLLTHARFEGYFRAVVEYAVAQMSAACIESGTLPGRVREAQLLAVLPHPDFRRYYVDGNERTLLDNLHAALAVQEWTWATNSYVGPISAQAIIGDHSYPSLTNLRGTFYKLGIDIVDELRRGLKADAEKLLQSIGDLRCAMAHEGMPPGISPSDITRNIRQLARVVRCIDRAVQTRVRAGCSRLPRSP